MIRTVKATRYVTPLREGGSLPAIVEADDDGLYVLKFRGAGQGPKVLIAELVAGEIGRTLGLRVPEIVFVELDPALGRNEPDFEIKALIEASGGLNLALDYLPGSLGFDPLAAPRLDPELASAIVWFDAYISNVDRTPRNTNMLLWGSHLWLIDHGASLFFHHSWAGWTERVHSPFPQIREHVLLPAASDVAGADERLPGRITPALLDTIVAAIPDEWLDGETLFASRDEHRAAYRHYLQERLEGPRSFAEEAINARAQRV